MTNPQFNNPYKTHIVYVFNGKEAFFTKDGIPIGFFDYTFNKDTVTLKFKGNNFRQQLYNHKILLTKKDINVYNVKVLKSVGSTWFSSAANGVYHENKSFKKVDDIINMPLLTPELKDYYKNARLNVCD